MTDETGKASSDSPGSDRTRPGALAAAEEKTVRSIPKTEPPKARKNKLSLADMLVGTVLADRYKLTRRIGEGAMGWVFLAEHTEIGKKCAVKVLRPALCRIEEAVSRFRREARAATQIGSKHIVDVSDFGATPNGAAFMVMEFLEDGEDLGTTLRRDGRLAWERVVHIAQQCCDALQAAHEAEIIHRDVKPANLYRLTKDGDEDFIKVLDFGIARLTTPKDSVVTATGVVMGTPDYMAPEQAQGRHVDNRADVYSLGACAYTLMAGRPPFKGTNEYDVIYKQLNEDPKAPSTVAPRTGIPPWLDAVILKAMAKKPDERFQSMQEMSEALARAGAPEPEAKTLTPGGAEAPEPGAPTASGSGPAQSVSGPIEVSSGSQPQLPPPPAGKSQASSSPSAGLSVATLISVGVLLVLLGAAAVYVAQNVLG